MHSQYVKIEFMDNQGSCHITVGWYAVKLKGGCLWIEAALIFVHRVAVKTPKQAVRQHWWVDNKVVVANIAYLHIQTTQSNSIVSLKERKKSKSNIRSCLCSVVVFTDSWGKFSSPARRDINVLSRPLASHPDAAATLYPQVGEVYYEYWFLSVR